MDPKEYANMFALEGQHWWYVTLHELVEAYVRELASGRKLEIFDAGCGTGGLLERLKKYGAVSGLDMSVDAVAFCRRRGLSGVSLGSLDDWQPASSSLDVITCIDVLYHERILDELTVLEKFSAALKPGGRLILQVPAFPFLHRRHDVFVQGKKRYRKKRFEAMLEQAGFRCRMSSYRVFAGFFAALAIKMVERLSSVKFSSDLCPVPTVLNRALLFVGRLDNGFVRSGIPLPLGSSLFVVAEKTR